MRTVAFVTQKGGSGKSTLASSLAVAAHEPGRAWVCVVDMDPQASLVTWAVRIVASTTYRSSRQAQNKLAVLLEAAEKNGVLPLVIIDTPGADGAASNRAAMKVADLNVIPLAPERVRPMGQRPDALAALKDSRSDYVFLLNQYPRHSSRLGWTKASRHWRSWAASFRRSFWPASTTRRPPPSWLGSDGNQPERPAAREIRALWSSSQAAASPRARPSPRRPPRRPDGGRLPQAGRPDFRRRLRSSALDTRLRGTTNSRGACRARSRALSARGEFEIVRPDGQGATPRASDWRQP